MIDSDTRIATFTSTSITPGEPGYPERSGSRVTVLRELGPTEAEESRMFRIRFADGTETDAFIDELHD